MFDDRVNRVYQKIVSLPNDHLCECNFLIGCLE